jgi:hypothetical protein
VASVRLQNIARHIDIVLNAESNALALLRNGTSGSDFTASVATALVRNLTKRLSLINAIAVGTPNEHLLKVGNVDFLNVD